MSFFNAFTLYQLAKGVEKANQNNRDRLIGADDARKTNEDRQAQLRNRVSRQIQLLDNPISKGAPVIFWNTLQYQIWIKEHSISQESFLAIADKESFVESSRLAIELNVQSGKELSHSDRDQLQAGISGWAAALLLKKGFVWKTILQQMRPNLPVLQGIIWNGKRTLGHSFALLGIVVVLLILFFPLAMIFAIAVKCVDYWRDRAAENLALLAETVGGHFSKTVKLSDVKQIVDVCESELESIGVPARRLSLDQIFEAYETHAGKVYSANERFNLGLDLTNLPLRIGAV